MSTSSDSELFTDDPLYDEERDLNPKLPGQTTDDIKALQPDRYSNMCTKTLQIPVHISIWKIYNHGYILDDNTKDQIIHFQY